MVEIALRREGERSFFGLVLGPDVLPPLFRFVSTVLGLRCAPLLLWLALLQHLDGTLPPVPEYQWLML